MEIEYFIEQLNENTHSATFQYWVVGEEEFKHRVNHDIPIPVPEGAAFDAFICGICQSLIYQSERRKVIAAAPGLGTLASRVGVTHTLDYTAPVSPAEGAIPVRTV